MLATRYRPNARAIGTLASTAFCGATTTSPALHGSDKAPSVRRLLVNARTVSDPCRWLLRLKPPERRERSQASARCAGLRSDLPEPAAFQKSDVSGLCAKSNHFLLNCIVSRNRDCLAYY